MFQIKNIHISCLAIASLNTKISFLTWSVAAYPAPILQQFIEKEKELKSMKTISQQAVAKY